MFWIERNNQESVSLVIAPFKRKAFGNKKNVFLRYNAVTITEPLVHRVTMIWQNKLCTINRQTGQIIHIMPSHNVQINRLHILFMNISLAVALTFPMELPSSYVKWRQNLRSVVSQFRNQQTFVQMKWSQFGKTLNYDILIA